jgi:cell division septal protein FtsQ
MSDDDELPADFQKVQNRKRLLRSLAKKAKASFSTWLCWVLGITLFIVLFTHMVFHK